MATGWSAALRNSILNAILRNTSLAIAGPLRLSLHTGDPVLTGTNEVTGGSYARQTVAFDAAASGATDGTSDVNFTGMPACTVTHVCLWDNATFLMGGALSSSKVVNAGDTFQLPADDIDVLLSQ